MSFAAGAFSSGLRGGDMQRRQQHLAKQGQSQMQLSITQQHHHHQHMHSQLLQQQQQQSQQQQQQQQQGVFSLNLSSSKRGSLSALPKASLDSAADLRCSQKSEVDAAAVAAAAFSGGGCGAGGGGGGGSGGPGGGGGGGRKGSVMGKKGKGTTDSRYSLFFYHVKY